MDKLRFWFLANQFKIVWFIVGWNSLNALYAFGRGAWLDVVINLGIIWLMLVLNK